MDTLSGETIGYQYDALRRLTSASSTAPWTQTFQYDGFGNLTAKVLNGTTTPIGVNATTNQLSSAYYDLNGNMTSGAGATLTYDVANRVATAVEASGGIEYYGYAPDNKRVFRQLANGHQQFTLYGLHGEKLQMCDVAPGWQFCPIYDWFGGKMIYDGGPVFPDRLGSNRSSGTITTTNNGARFLPYGEEITATSNDREKFATYTRDSYTGLDYADQRFYASSYGRFNTPDPFGGSAHVGNPGSWNRYSYTLGDPINSNDPTGQEGFTLAAGNANTTYVAGYGNACPYGEDNVGVISGTACLDTTTVLENSIIGEVGGLNVPGVNGPVYDVGATFSVDGTASANPVPSAGNGTIGPNYNSIISLSVTTNYPTVLLGGLLGGVAGPQGAFIGGLLGSMCGIGVNFSYVPLTGSLYGGAVGTCGAGVNAGSGIQVTDVEVPPLQDPNRIADGWSTSVTKVLPFSGQPGSTAAGGTATSSPGSGPAVYGPAFGNRTPISVSVGVNRCLLNCRR